MCKHNYSFKYGLIICEQTDGAIGLLKKQCEVITDKLSRIFCLDKYSVLIHPFDINISNREYSIPSFTMGSNTIINYPKKNLSKLCLYKDDLCPDLVHEITHIIWFDRNDAFLSEGLAVAMSYMLSDRVYFPYSIKKTNESLYEGLISKLTMDVLKEISQYNLNAYDRLMNWEDSIGIGIQNLYGIAGAYVLYIIEKNSIGKLNEVLYSEESSFEHIFEMSKEQLFLEFVKDCIQNKLGEENRRNKNPIQLLDLLDCKWKFADDSTLGGNSKICFEKQERKIRVKGKIGSGGIVNGFSAGVDCQKHMLIYKQDYIITLKLYGSNTEVQVWVSTSSHCEPGEELMYMIRCSDKPIQYKIPLSQFNLFTGNMKGIENEQIQLIGVRVLGYFGMQVDIYIDEFNIQV